MKNPPCNTCHAKHGHMPGCPDDPETFAPGKETKSLLPDDLCVEERGGLHCRLRNGHDGECDLRPRCGTFSREVAEGEDGSVVQCLLPEEHEGFDHLFPPDAAARAFEQAEDESARTFEVEVNGERAIVVRGDGTVEGPDDAQLELEVEEPIENIIDAIVKLRGEYDDQDAICKREGEKRSEIKKALEAQIERLVEARERDLDKQEGLPF